MGQPLYIYVCHICIFIPHFLSSFNWAHMHTYVYILQVCSINAQWIWVLSTTNGEYWFLVKFDFLYEFFMLKTFLFYKTWHNRILTNMYVCTYAHITVNLLFNIYGINESSLQHFKIKFELSTVILSLVQYPER